MKNRTGQLSRRELLQWGGALGLTMGLAPWQTLRAASMSSLGSGTPDDPLELTIAQLPLRIAEHRSTAVVLNGQVPGPLVRLREGQDFVARVHNRLDQETSIHWHGLLLPAGMDGVPGVSFAGIRPGEIFTYRFPIRQHGTYWYHSHSGMQEQRGHYGALIIDPAGPDPVAFEREHVVILSDWLHTDPHHMMAQLKQQSDADNFQKPTLMSLVDEARQSTWRAAVRNRLDWAAMRMNPSDIADITSHSYTYLLNGQACDAPWEGRFTPGERVRLRIINAASMSYFNLRIPGLRMTVVQADGQDVAPVTVDELQIAVAETYDVVVTPTEDRAFTLFAESMDRSGYACGFLSPRPGLRAELPALRAPPRRTMIDMGMAPHAGHGMDHGVAAEETQRPAGHHGVPPHSPEAHGGPVSGAAPHVHHEAAASGAPLPRSEPGPIVARHGPDTHGPGNTSIAEVQRNRLAEPGTGLAGVGHRVLVYTDLRRLAHDFDARPPARELELHLTGHMSRYLWSFDGRKYSDAPEPIHFRHGERLRLILANDTMMEHPIHLHGMWMELENGHGPHIPRKHTISVKPAERLSALISADASGDWAFHCHLLYHMDLGMFRVVRVG